LLPVQPIAQRLPLDIRHGEPELVTSLAGVEHGQDVGVLEPSSKADLALESLGAEHGREVGMENLQRDWPIVAKVAGQKHRGHAAATELALDRVAARQSAIQPRAEVRHSWVLV